MTKVFTNISALYQTREHSEQIARGTFMAEVPSIENAFIKAYDGLIQSFGTMDELIIEESDQVIDLNGRIVTPTFVDSHTHLVFAADRDENCRTPLLIIS